MSIDNPMRILEVLRDLLRIYENFVGSMGEFENQYNVGLSNLSEVFNGQQLMKFIILAPTLEPQKQIIFVRALGSVMSILEPIKNPNALNSTQKKELAHKLDDICRDLELLVGIGTMASKPTDLDIRLLAQCMNKNYHDTVSNAFPILEDRIRQKLSVNRDYHGSELIDLAFNPKTGKLVLGETEAEKEGTYFLFKGALMFIRNPPAHTQSGEEDRNSALKVMHTVDFLLKMVDKAKLR